MNKVKPTKLQLKTLEIKRDHPEMPLGKAMIQAGYSKKTAIAPKHNYLEKRGVAVAMETWREMLRGAGLHENWLIGKYKEWGSATKIKSSMTKPDKIVPDYETQLKVKDDIRKDLGLVSDSQPVTTMTNVQVNFGDLVEEKK